MKVEEGVRKEKLLKKPGGKRGHGYDETDKEKCREYKLTAFKEKHTHEGHIAECSKADLTTTPLPQFQPLIMYLTANKITKVRVSD
jgi:hypothetical protein